MAALFHTLSILIAVLQLDWTTGSVTSPHASHPPDPWAHQPAPLLGTGPVSCLRLFKSCCSSKRHLNSHRAFLTPSESCLFHTYLHTCFSLFTHLILHCLYVSHPWDELLSPLQAGPTSPREDRGFPECRELEAERSSGIRLGPDRDAGSSVVTGWP